jgi:hypothetical protein
VSIVRHLAAARRLLFVAAAIGALSACGLIVGVKDLEVTGDDDDDTDRSDAKADVELLPDRFAPAADIAVQPPVDAGCDAVPFGTFEPTDFRFGPDGNSVMGWVNDASKARGDDNDSFTLAAYTPLPPNPTLSRAVKFQGFNPSVPDNKRVVGLAVNIKAKSSREDFFVDNDVSIRLDFDGTITSANHRNATAWPTEFEKRTYGGPNTLWELEKSLTPAAVNSADFGVVYVLQRPSNNAADQVPDFYLDQLSITIYTCD